MSYSWGHNTISDLANTQCGSYGDRLVCSPLHAAMNLSFLVLGVTMIGGALLLGKRFAGTHLSRFGFGCMVAAGMGTIVVGFFPENTVGWLHIIGAALPFVVGNIGMIAIGGGMKVLPVYLRVYSVLSGIVGLVALVLFLLHSYVGLGIGGRFGFSVPGTRTGGVLGVGLVGKDLRLGSHDYWTSAITGVAGRKTVCGLVTPGASSGP